MAGPLLEEKWVRWVALTTTILAVSAAIASLKGGSYSTRIQLSTTLESNRWGYYQAKSIKQHLMEMQRDLFDLYGRGTNPPAVQQFVDAKRKDYDAEVARYEKEKNTIKADAEKVAKEIEDFKRHGANFGLAVMFFQIAIMLSSVSALLKKKALWLVGLAFGAVALVYMTNGFCVFF